MGAQQVRDPYHHAEGHLADDFGYQTQTRSLPPACPNATIMFANHGVTLLVADTIPPIHNLRTLVNAHPVRDGSPRLLPTGLSLVARIPGTQIPSQVSNPANVIVDVRVDGFLIEREIIPQCKPLCRMNGAHVLSNQHLETFSIFR